MLQNLTHCPCCGATVTDSQRLFAVPMLSQMVDVLQCRDCQLIYKAAVPNAAGLAQIYTSDYVHFQTEEPIGLGERLSNQRKLSQCQKLLPPSWQQQPKSALNLVDVGCGSGRFVQVARDVGYNATGIDAYLPESCSSDNLQALTPDQLPPDHYQIVTLLNVAEHLTDPVALFISIRRILKSRGVFLLTCPYGDSIARQVYTAQWSHLALEEHLLFWNPANLTRVLRQVGFTGQVKYRISGSPFPQGKTSVTTPLATTSQADQSPSSASTPSWDWRKTLWTIGKEIQRQKLTAEMTRQMIHWFRLGDYLELAIVA